MMKATHVKEKLKLELFRNILNTILSVMTAVTFPLRPSHLAFAICGWRWQNDVYEIKYSVCKKKKTSVHEFYPLKALITLEQVNTTEWLKKNKNLN